MDKPMMSESWRRPVTVLGALDVAAALSEAQRVMKATEPEDAPDGLGSAILGWPYHDTSADVLYALAEALSAFISAHDQVSYLAAEVSR